MGHVVRCVNTALFLRGRGVRTGFLVNGDNAVRERLEAAGFDYLLCGVDDPAGVELTDAVAVVDTKKDISAQARALKAAGRKAVVIENLTAMDSADAVIIPSPVYNGPQVEGKVFAGADYVIMGGNFLEARPTGPVRGRSLPLKVLVTMGGADPNGLTGLVVSALKDFPGIEVTVVIGPAAGMDEEARALMRESGGIFSFVTGASDLAPYMKDADIAFTAAGTTAYELAYMGVPSLLLANYREDGFFLSEVERLGVGVGLGYYGDVGPEKIRDSVRGLLEDRERREELSRNAFELIDGRGSERVASVIGALVSVRQETGAKGPFVKVKLRPATLNDSELLLNWRNDPVTRENSVNTCVVTEKEHGLWLSRALVNASVRLFVAISGGEPVGAVRAERLGDGTTELSWTIAPGKRGRGFGKAMVAEALALSGGTVVARIKSGNAASRRIAEAAGFTMTGKEGEMTFWTISNVACA